MPGNTKLIRLVDTIKQEKQKQKQQQKQQQQKQLEMKKIKNFVSVKARIKSSNSYAPTLNKKKYLVIMACHCDSKIKADTIPSNLKYFQFKPVDIILINTCDLPYNSMIRNTCETNNIKYFEMENTPTCDFGKWVKVLQETDYSVYDYIVFTNDSFIIKAPITHFFNLISKNDVELYGYNDSTQNNYHYQSYLFSLKKEAIPIFINKYNEKKDIITGQTDVINNYEIGMSQWFNTKNCFLKIGNFNSNKGHNIYFTNDKLYTLLNTQLLLPFIKIKRIT